MRTETQDQRNALLRRAAELGPGCRGLRQAGTREERLALAARLAEVGERPPDYLESSTEWVDRKARLFLAGDYPDKNVSIDESQLAALAASFDLPVPVLIEHAASPLELGYLTDVRSEGPALMGTIALTPEANALIDRSGARGLSLGLSPDFASIREVSLVRRPRVASATLFSDGPMFEGEVETRAGEECASDQVADWLRRGLIRPSQACFAEALIATPQSIAFGDGFVPVAELVRRLVDSGTGHGLFRETAPDPVRSPVEMDDVRTAFYRRYFPGLDLAEIAKRR